MAPVEATMAPVEATMAPVEERETETCSFKSCSHNCYTILSNEPISYNIIGFEESCLRELECSKPHDCRGSLEECIYDKYNVQFTNYHECVEQCDKDCN